MAGEIAGTMKGMVERIGAALEDSMRAIIKLVGKVEEGTMIEAAEDITITENNQDMITMETAAMVTKVEVGEISEVAAVGAIEVVNRIRDLPVGMEARDLACIEAGSSFECNKYFQERQLSLLQLRFS